MSLARETNEGGPVFCALAAIAASAHSASLSAGAIRLANVGFHAAPDARRFAAEFFGGFSKVLFFLGPPEFGRWSRE